MEGEEQKVKDLETKLAAANEALKTALMQAEADKTDAKKKVQLHPPRPNNPEPTNPDSEPQTPTRHLH